MPGFGQPTLASVMRRVEADDPGLERLDLTNNASFRMKPDASIGALFAALRSNAVVKVLILRELQIGDSVMEALAELLSENHAIAELDLQQNQITSAGVIALAHGLAKNRSVHTLNLMNQKTRTFGEACVEIFKDVFHSNVTLTKLQWQVASRNTSALAKSVTRNVEIWRCVAGGRDYCALLPDHMREAPPDLSALPEDRPAAFPSPPSPSKLSSPQLLEDANSPGALPLTDAEEAEQSALAELAEISALMTCEELPPVEKAIADTPPKAKLLGGDEAMTGAQEPQQPSHGMLKGDPKLPELDLVEDLLCPNLPADKTPLPSVRWTPSNPPSPDPARPAPGLQDASVGVEPQLSAEALPTPAETTSSATCASAGLVDLAASTVAVTSGVSASEPGPRASVTEPTPEVPPAEVTLETPIPEYVSKSSAEEPLAAERPPDDAAPETDAGAARLP